jgi:hypothetical protein
MKTNPTKACRRRIARGDSPPLREGGVRPVRFRADLASRRTQAVLRDATPAQCWRNALRSIIFYRPIARATPLSPGERWRPPYAVAPPQPRRPASPSVCPTSARSATRLRLARLRAQIRTWPIGDIEGRGDDPARPLQPKGAASKGYLEGIGRLCARPVIGATTMRRPSSRTETMTQRRFFTASGWPASLSCFQRKANSMASPRWGDLGLVDDGVAIVRGS